MTLPSDLGVIGYACDMHHIAPFTHISLQFFVITIFRVQKRQISHWFTALTKLNSRLLGSLSMVNYRLLHIFIWFVGPIV